MRGRTSQTTSSALIHDNGVSIPAYPDQAHFRTARNRSGLWSIALILLTLLALRDLVNR